MNVLVLGGTGMTGRLFVNELLARDHDVTVVARSSDKIDAHFGKRERLTVISGNVLEMDFLYLKKLAGNADAIGSCLGHNLTLRGMFGKPRRLVTDSLERICKAVMDADGKKIKLVLMNTTGVKNTDQHEKWEKAEKPIMAIISILLPPQSDNESAAEFLRAEIGRNNPHIEWVCVRPDTLVNEAAVSAYTVFPSPIRSPLFNPGTTSRSNVASFMAGLLSDEKSWNDWKGKMPVVYNASAVSPEN